MKRHLSFHHKTVSKKDFSGFYFYESWELKER